MRFRNYIFVMIALFAPSKMYADLCESGFSLPENNDDADSNSLPDALKAKVKPSKHQSHGRWDVENFVENTIGKDFLLHGGRIRIQIAHGEHNEKLIRNVLNEMKLNSHFTDAGHDQLDFELNGDSRVLVNLLTKLCPESFDFVTTYNPRTETFVIDLESSFHPA